MYSGKSFLALIPARSGSKGLYRKNITYLSGKPLIAWTIDAALKSMYIDRTVVSTDDEEIAEVAKEHGADVPFMRPADIASDEAKMLDVIFHAMEHFENAGNKFDYVILLQPTSPLRSQTHIDGAIEYLFEKQAEAVLSVTEMEHSPLRANVLPDDLNMADFIKSEWRGMNRQQLPVYYRLNGALYIAGWDFLKTHKTWYSPKTFAYIMDRRCSIDIDTAEDLLYAEVLLKLGSEFTRNS